jgi:hypothetical protein
MDQALINNRLAAITTMNWPAAFLGPNNEQAILNKQLVIFESRDACKEQNIFLDDVVGDTKTKSDYYNYLISIGCICTANNELGIGKGDIVKISYNTLDRTTPAVIQEVITKNHESDDAVAESKQSKSQDFINKSSGVPSSVPSDGSMIKDPEVLINRALSVTSDKTGIVWKMGGAGDKMRPTDPLPTPDGTSDCVNFIAWVLGRKKAADKKWKYWMQTSNIWNDAFYEKKQVLFKRIPKPIRGSFVIYPDELSPSKKSGHIALIIDPDPKHFIVVDCGSHNKANKLSGKGGIAMRDGSFFLKHPKHIFFVAK